MIDKSKISMDGRFSPTWESLSGCRVPDGQFTDTTRSSLAKLRPSRFG